MNAGALSFPWMGEEMSFQCRDHNGRVLDFAWQYWYNGEATPANTWFVAYIDDRAGEGDWLCAFTRNDRSVLDITVSNDPLVWTHGGVCIYQANNGVYQAPGNNSCDDIRGL